MKRSLRRAALAACALLVTLSASACTGGGGGDEDEPPDPEPTLTPLPDPDVPRPDTLRRMWQTPAFEVGAMLYLVNDLWLTEGAVIAVLSSGVTAHDPATGEELWRLEPPDGAGALCAASAAPNDDGVGAVVYSPADAPAYDPGACSLLAAVDVGADAGEVRWSRELPDPGGDALVDAITEGGTLTVGEEVIAVDVDLEGDHPTARFAIGDGEELPALPVPGGEDCRPERWAHSARFTIAQSECDLFVYDTETGSGPVRRLPAWEEGGALAGVLPGSTLVLGRNEQLVVYEDGAGVVEVEIPDPDPGPGFVADAVVADGVLIRPTGRDTLTGTHYAGWDLVSGRLLWAEDLSGHPQRAPRDGLHPPVLTTETVDGQGRLDCLGWLDARDGTVSGAGCFPEDTERRAIVTDDGYVYALAEGDDSETVSLVGYELPG